MQVRLEPQTEAHAEGLFAAMQAAEIYTFLGTEPPATVDAVRQRIARQNKGPQDESGERWLNWIILVDGSIAGYTQATIKADQTATLAYVLTPAFWGRSVAYEACRQTLTALLSRGDVSRVIADAEVGNSRSRALLTRLGFRLIHETDGDAFYDGGSIQTLVAHNK
jgi:RimJ/RimL family protein N-acetyltransferase